MFVKDHMPFWVYVITEKGNKIKGLRSKSRFWEVKSLEPTFLPKFGSPVMFVIDHVTFRVYVITRGREQNKRSEEAKTEFFWEVKLLEPTFLPKFGRPVSSCS